MPLDPLWKDNEFPDVRVKETNHKTPPEVFLGQMGWMERCFCANCGKPHGAVTKEWAKYIFALCDECVEKHGPPPGTMRVPDAVAEGRK